MTRITVRDTVHWHELRHKNIGASESGALFGELSYLTYFELWHRKMGALEEPDLDSVERVFWGKTLEPAVAAGVADQTGWNIQKIHTYWTHDTVKGMGASLDYEIISNEKGPGVLEIKCVDGLQFRDWEGERGEEQPPVSYELQIQHQMAVTKRAWGAIAVLIGGNRLRIFERDRHEETIAKIIPEIEYFWESVKAKREPQPDFARDGDAIRELYVEVQRGKEIDLRQDNELATILPALALHREQARDHQKGADAMVNMILYKMKDAVLARAPAGWEIKAPVQKRKGFTVEETSFRKVSAKEV